MNEISKQIIELGKLIGKKVFVKRYSSCGYYCSTDTTGIFTIEDFEYYSYRLIKGKIKLTDIIDSVNFGGYYLVIFNNLK